MSKVVIAGDASGTGTFTISAPNGNTDRTLVLPDEAGTLVTTASLPNPLTSGTAVASTSGTSIDFTSIPSWVKRITVMFNGVSTNGSSDYAIRIGDSGGIVATGYASASIRHVGGYVNNGSQYTTSYGLNNPNGASSTFSGAFVLMSFGSNTWVANGVIGDSNGTSAATSTAGGTKTLSGTLDKVRITTVSGTNTFDAGSINIMYE